MKEFVNMKKRTIIVDIDGTLANCKHRLHHINDFKNDVEATFKADWDAFYERCNEDKPIKGTVALVKDLKKAGWGIILITGRSDMVRAKTMEWLSMHAITYDILLMRKHGDHTSDVTLKRQWLHDLREGRIVIPYLDPPTMALEDRARVVDMWREEGLIALQCAEGDF